ncbi:MAG: hypothetical protein ABI390_00840 [Daejeonella sp.]
MKQIFYFSVPLFLLIISCNSSEKSSEVNDSLQKDSLKKSILLNDKALLLLSQDSSKIDSALILANRSIEFNPANVIAHTNKLNWLCNNNEFEKAYQEVQILDKLSPGNPETILLYGLLAERLNKADIAKAKYKEAFVLNDKSFKAMDSDGKTFQLARANWASSLYFFDEDKGLAEFKRIRSEYPENTIAANFLNKSRDELITQVIRKR